MRRTGRGGIARPSAQDGMGITDQAQVDRHVAEEHGFSGLSDRWALQLHGNTARCHAKTEGDEYQRPLAFCVALLTGFARTEAARTAQAMVR